MPEWSRPCWLARWCQSVRRSATATVCLSARVVAQAVVSSAPGGELQSGSERGLDLVDVVVAARELDDCCVGHAVDLPDPAIALAPAEPELT